MLGFEIAALLAQWGSLRRVVGTAIGRFVNPNTLAALAIAGAIVAVIVGLWWLRLDAAGDATATRDAAWREAIAAERADTLTAQRARDLAAARAAAAERARWEAARDGAIARAAALERELARLEGEGGDPVVLPRSLVRRLREGDAP